jgi:DNA-binding NtrC family response regulator
MPRVLIVDDEPGIRFALKRWFERQQWTVEEAQDGRQALHIIEREDSDTAFDVIVSDLHLPGISGEELLQSLMASRPALAARLILTTGDAVQDAAHDNVLATHPHVLQKPFDLGTLRAAVERVLG